MKTENRKEHHCFLENEFKNLLNESSVVKIAQVIIRL